MMIQRISPSFQGKAILYNNLPEKYALAKEISKAPNLKIKNEIIKGLNGLANNIQKSTPDDEEYKINYKDKVEHDNVHLANVRIQDMKTKQTLVDYNWHLGLNSQRRIFPKLGSKDPNFEAIESEFKQQRVISLTQPDKADYDKDIYYCICNCHRGNIRLGDSDEEMKEFASKLTKNLEKQKAMILAESLNNTLIATNTDFDGDDEYEKGLIDMKVNLDFEGDNITLSAFDNLRQKNTVQINFSTNKNESASTFENKLQETMKSFRQQTFDAAIYDSMLDIYKGLPAIFDKI